MFAKLAVKALGLVAKNGAKEVDVGNPVVLDTVDFVITIAKEVIKPW